MRSGESQGCGQRGRGRLCGRLVRGRRLRGRLVRRCRSRRGLGRRLLLDRPTVLVVLDGRALPALLPGALLLGLVELLLRVVELLLGLLGHLLGFVEEPHVVSLPGCRVLARSQPANAFARSTWPMRALRTIRRVTWTKTSAPDYTRQKVPPALCPTRTPRRSNPHSSLPVSGAAARGG